MNATKITASLLAITMLLSSDVGALALAQEGAIPSAAEVSITVPIEASKDAPTAEPTKAPTAEPTEVLAATPTEVLAATPTETLAATPTETLAATPTETLAATPTETLAATPTETLAATPTETPAATPTETLEATPTETLAATPSPTPVPVVSEGYVFVKRGTTIYSDVKCREALGELSEDSILYLRDVEQHEDLYEAQFDTEMTEDGSTCEWGYLEFSGVNWLADDASTLAQMESKRTIKDINVPFVSFKYVKEVETPATEAPATEPPTTEPPTTEVPTTEPPTTAPPATDPPATEEPNQYNVTCVDSTGAVLLRFSVPAQAALTVEEIQGLTTSLCDGQLLKGWYLYDERGMLIIDHPVDTDIWVTQDLWLMAVIEDTPVQPEPTVEPNRSAEVTVSRDTDALALGTTITLHANLEGYDGVSYTCNWQTAEIDMQGNLVGEWQDTGISTTELSYTLAEENLLIAWRLCVIVGE